MGQRPAEDASHERDHALVLDLVQFFCYAIKSEPSFYGTMTFVFDQAVDEQHDDDEDAETSQSSVEPKPELEVSVTIMEGSDHEVKIMGREGSYPRVTVTLGEPPDGADEAKGRVRVPYDQFLLIYSGKASAKEMARMAMRRQIELTGFKSFMQFGFSFDYSNSTWDGYYEAKEALVAAASREEIANEVAPSSGGEMMSACAAPTGGNGRRHRARMTESTAKMSRFVSEVESDSRVLFSSDAFDKNKHALSRENGDGELGGSTNDDGDRNDQSPERADKDTSDEDEDDDGKGGGSAGRIREEGNRSSRSTWQRLKAWVHGDTRDQDGVAKGSNSSGLNRVLVRSAAHLEIDSNSEQIVDGDSAMDQQTRTGPRDSGEPRCVHRWGKVDLTPSCIRTDDIWPSFLRRLQCSQTMSSTSSSCAFITPGVQLQSRTGRDENTRKEDACLFGESRRILRQAKSLRESCEDYFYLVDRSRYVEELAASHRIESIADATARMLGSGYNSSESGVGSGWRTQHHVAGCVGATAAACIFGANEARVVWPGLGSATARLAKTGLGSLLAWSLLRERCKSDCTAQAAS